MDSKKHIKIDQDDYIRPEVTKQDIISSDKDVSYRLIYIKGKF